MKKSIQCDLSNNLYSFRKESWQPSNLPFLTHVRARVKRMSGFLQFHISPTHWCINGSDFFTLVLMSEFQVRWYMIIYAKQRNYKKVSSTQNLLHSEWVDFCIVFIGNLRILLQINLWFFRQQKLKWTKKWSFHMS